MSYHDIIQHVKSNPVLWQSSLLHYRHRNVLIDTWIQIAKELKVDEKTLRKSWWYLRTLFRKLYVRTLSSEDPEAEEKLIYWPYYKEMCFLKPEIVIRRSRTVPSDTSAKKNDNAGESSSSLIEKEFNNVNVPIDPDYMYLMSILPSIKSLSEIKKMQFRGRVNDWLIDIYKKNEYPSSECSADASSNTYMKMECVVKQEEPYSTGNNNSDSIY